MPASALRWSISGLCGRGSIEERAVPGAHNEVQDWNGNRSYGAYECCCGGNCRDWRSRVHDHANRAMIGIGGGGMDVGDLNKSHKRQQQDADQRGCARYPGAARAAVPELFHCVFHSNPADTTRIHRFEHRNAGLAVRKRADSIWLKATRPRAT